MWGSRLTLSQGSNDPALLLAADDSEWTPTGLPFLLLQIMTFQLASASRRRGGTWDAGGQLDGHDAHRVVEILLCEFYAASYVQYLFLW